MDPLEIKKGEQYRIVFGVFDHIMRVRSAYRGFFMMESPVVGLQCISWRDITEGHIKIYTVV
jgi:hypothetical protein